MSKSPYLGTLYRLHLPWLVEPSIRAASVGQILPMARTRSRHWKYKDYELQHTVPMSEFYVNENVGFKPTLAEYKKAVCEALSAMFEFKPMSPGTCILYEGDGLMWNSVVVPSAVKSIGLPELELPVPYVKLAVVESATISNT